LAKLARVRFFSASEYEFGFIAVGSAPIGIIALGVAPVGVVSIGVVPVGLLTFACGGSLGLVNFVCGAGFGGYVRAVGLAIGGNASAVGFHLSLVGDRDADDEPTSRLSTDSYWLRMNIAAALVLLLLWPVAYERFAVTRMDRIVRAAWRVHPSKVEGIYVAPDSECRADALMRSDGHRRLHVDLSLTCGSLLLAERRLRSGCTVVQHDDGRAYDLRCSAERIPAKENEDGVEPEVPGLWFDSIASPGRAGAEAHGPPPMHIELSVEAPSQAISGDPLLPDGLTELTGASGYDYLQMFAQ
jgi:hypothetical protein